MCPGNTTQPISFGDFDQFAGTQEETHDHPPVNLLDSVTFAREVEGLAQHFGLDLGSAAEHIANILLDIEAAKVSDSVKESGDLSREAVDAAAAERWKTLGQYVEAQIATYKHPYESLLASLGVIISPLGAARQYAEAY